MAQQPNFGDARRRLDEALGRLATPAEDGSDQATPSPDQARGPTSSWSEPPRLVLPPPPAGAPVPPAEPPLPVQTTEALTRLLVGAAVLGLDGLAQRAGAWERAAGIERGTPDETGRQIPVRTTGGTRFRHGLIGWVFETEEELRPQGNPLQWLRGVVGHLSGSVFSVVFDALPRLGPRLPRAPQADRVDQETARWVARGQLEEQRSRAFALVAIDDLLADAIPHLARQRGVQQAVAELVRSPAMDDAIVTLARRPGVQQAVAELVRSPAIDDAIAAIVRSPAMEDAIAHLVRTRAMEDAIETLAHSPALVELVQTQSSTIAGGIVEEVRERGVSADSVLEAVTRRILRRPPRNKLPPEAQGLFVAHKDR